MANNWWMPQVWRIGNNPYAMPVMAPESHPGVLGTIYQQPANFANVLGQNYGNYASGLAGLGNDYAGAYGAYSSGVGNVTNAKASVDAARAAAAGQMGVGAMNAYAGMGNAAANGFGAYGSALASLYNSRANEASARYGANAMAEAARQAGAANLGSAALGAYGSASNAAMAAWAANQQAYNDAAARATTANQQGLSQYGQSRNMALGSLGNTYGDLGKESIKASMASNVFGNLSFNMGGGGGAGSFGANGPGGPVASGTYSGGGGGSLGGGGSASISKSSSPSSPSSTTTGILNSLADLRNDIMDRGPGRHITDMLAGEAAAARRQLDAQHYSSREMPSKMQGDTLKGLLTMLNGPRGAYSQLNDGMNQFYANNQFNEQPYQSAVGALGGAYGDFNKQMYPAMAAVPGIASSLLGQMGQDDGFYSSSMDKLGRGYDTAGSRLDRLAGQMSGGYFTANRGVMDLYDKSIGTLPMWYAK